MSNEYRGDRIIAATVIGLCFSITAVALRIVARRHQGMKQYAEDYFIYLGLVKYFYE